MSCRSAINCRRSYPLPSTVTSMQPALTYCGSSTSLTPVHTGGMLGSWSQTRNLVVSICPHPLASGAGALARVILLQPGCPFVQPEQAPHLLRGCDRVLGQGPSARSLCRAKPCQLIGFSSLPDGNPPDGWLSG